MQIHALYHVPFEGLGHIGQWIKARGHHLTESRLFQGDSLPDAKDYDRLIVMGGPMNIYEHERYPWLVDEKACINQGIDAGKSVLGVCLGAQLIADVLGSRVYAGPEKEIGWFPVELTEAGRRHPVLQGLAREFVVFHWHGDTFDLPAGSVRLASSAVCDNQAFLYGDRVLGLQFHLESTPESVQAITTSCEDELIPGQRFIQSAEEIRAQGPQHYLRINQIMEQILDRLP